jgi:DNA-binding transcriptional LysR family regulator
LPDDRRRIIEAAREVDRAVQLVGRLLEGARTPVAGEVRVTSTDSFCQVLLPAVLAGIAAEAPDLRLTLISSNAYVDLGRTQADITVRPTVRLPDELVGERAAELGFAAYERQGGNDLWLGLTGQLERTIAARWLADNVAREAMGDGADSFLTLRELAALGRGRAILPCFLGDDDGRLTRIDGGIPEMSVGVWVACHADLADVPRLSRTRRLLAQGLAGRARELLGVQSGG